MTSTMASTKTDHAGGISVLELDGRERGELEALARTLTRAGAGLVDDTGWQARARAESCRLPARLSRTVRAFRHDAGPDGTLTVTNLPVAPELLPATPTVPDSVERGATVPAALAVLLGCELGTVIAYRDEKHGALVQNVVPVPTLAGSQSNGGSVQLEFHTENAFHPHRPDFVGLLCLRPAHEDQVGTQVASIRRARPLLDAATLTVLQEDRFVTEAPPSFRTAELSSPLPVLTGAPEDPDICVDFHATRALDNTAEKALVELREALSAVRQDVVLRPGDMIFVDNRLVVHGRVAFSPRYDGTDRWLHRVFVHLDHRRSRGHRPGDGPVLT
ncbi:TauD/TfdA family dioxygenase [Kitasatospora paracochleata]|uniref:L-asparagine oxygenase n=1 Tax=Kitasatospora paracochleata TaxID=58354 RepID=A0ABT1JA99_9ACTN|nr:TauD/TfdA family dioxygenase [Kitasatospora paracochleata]MCP2314377.1 L-asparagine oxygenase [Kitasatospora paracochleata]